MKRLVIKRNDGSTQVIISKEINCNPETIAHDITYNNYKSITVTNLNFIEL
jgi:hypothetical protein